MTSFASATQDAGEIGDNRLFAGLRDRITAADPAFSRLRLASRAMLAVLLSALILGAITLIQPLPVAAYGTAVVVAFLGSMAINDNGGKAQAITRLYAEVITVVAVMASSILVQQPVVADLAFLAVIFGAVYIRRFGQRWFGLGMLAFMAYFMGDYMRPAIGDIGWIAVATALTLAVTHIVNNFLLRNDPERDFRRAMITVDRRINLILRELRSPNGQSGRQLQNHLSRLREIVLMAEGFLPQGAEGSLAAEGAASDLAIALFDLQLTVERLVRAGTLAPLPYDLVDAALHRDQLALNRRAARFGAEQGEAARLLNVLERARLKLDATLGLSPSPAFAAAKTPGGTSMPSGSGAAANQAGGLVPVALQLPIQVTLACAAAMSVGLLLSPVRWYWAVITAFIVFNNTRSRADTLVRAFQRSAGTFAGVLLGTAIAILMHGQMIPSIIGILVLFFFAFYFLATSYSLMILLITIALALLYGLMGMFTPQLLVLRLEETVVGGLAGALAAFLIFPSRASLAVGTSLDKYLTALGDLVAAARDKAHREGGPRDLVALSRGLDRSYADLATAVRPLGGPWNAVTRFGQVREKLLLLTGSAHWGRVLAQTLSVNTTLPEESVARIDALALEISGQIASIGNGKEQFFDKPGRTRRGAISNRHIPASVSETTDPVLALEAIATLLDHAIIGAGGKAGETELAENTQISAGA